MVAIIQSVAKWYHWNKCSKSLLSSLATVRLWQEANMCSETRIISAAWGLNKLDSPKRIISTLWWQPSEEKNDLTVNKRQQIEGS